MTYSVAIATETHARLVVHLARADRQEDLCFAVYRAGRGRQRTTALIGEPILPLDGEREVHGNASFTGGYFLRALDQARAQNAGLAVLHSHPGGRGWQDMSSDDVAAEHGHAAQAQAVLGLPLVGLTLATGDLAWSARIWRRVGRGAAQLADTLANAPEPEPTPDALREALATAEDDLGNTTARLLEISDELARALETQRQAQAQHAVVARARTLDEQLAPLEQVREQEGAFGAQLHELQAGRLQAERALAEERQHRDEVAREGRDARCLRCRRPYGDQYESILAAFDDDIEQWNQRRSKALSALQAARDEHQQLVGRLDALRHLEGERASLTVPDGPLPDTDAIRAQLEHFQGEQERLQARRTTLTEQLSQLKATLNAAVTRQDERRKLLDQIAHARGEDELLTGQLAQLPANDYDPSAHEQIRVQLRTAQEAEARCARLRPKAEQVELLERRLATEQEAATKAAVRAAELRELADARRGDQDALKQAESKVAALDEQLRAAEAAVTEAEQRALRESKDVEAAREALKRARGEQRQLRAERRELRYRSVTAELLKAYAADAQRRAFPTLEKEAAELLSHLSSGRYADVGLDENAGLHLFADGAHRPLKRFSGGEQDLANLCLRLALSRTLARQRGTDAGLIILDEVFGSQDLDRRRVLLEQLRELDREFRQVFIVSHFDDVVAVCDVQVDVERIAGVSRAEVHAR